MAIKYDPKNLFLALGSFAVGSFLTWWFVQKISVFTAFFSTNFPKILIYVSFLVMFVNWTIIIPYLMLTGANISMFTYFRTITFSFLGLMAILLGFPLLSVLLPILETITSMPLITTIAWLVMTGGIMYLSIYKPIDEVQNNKNDI